MRKTILVLASAVALTFTGTLAVNAQLSNGANTIVPITKNYTPIEKAACGPRWGRWCGPWHHRVCRFGHCWCARC
ncbi:MAG TPA: hypothetical protein VFA57_09750 [Pseudolabrys sp.]|nr:hypothetical protein [Pseudolabrys sp.]